MVGTTISHYKILEKLGEGGMGVVYKAEDSKLQRPVALKFLPPHLSSSEADKARFIQEARAASSLNHPNVCTIHDIQEHEGQLFIVMEFVEGQTLSDRMKSAPEAPDGGPGGPGEPRLLPLKQVLGISIQIADGLAAAHDKGIVHRDIKPENIMIRKDGIVQIMDFGLAKLRASSEKVSRLTKEGSTVGTAGYMSPEQVQGQEVDHRSDIFAFGVLLYQLLTGELPFKGIHETALLYEIVNVDPTPVSMVKPEIDPELDRIVLECLEKDPDERYQAAKDIAKDLKRFKRESSRQRASRIFPARPGIRSTQGMPAGSEGAGEGVQVHQRKGLTRFRRDPLAWSMAALFLLVSALLLVSRPHTSSERRHPIRSTILPPEGVDIHSFGGFAGPPTFSPDGQQIVFVGLAPDGVFRLYVRSLDALKARVLEGTEGAYYPFWSPDGKSIGFIADWKLKKVGASGTPPITIYGPMISPRGASWNAEGTILYAPGFQEPLYKVSAEGGTPEQVTTLDSARGEGSHRWPFFLPDGKHFLYLARTRSESGQAEGDAVCVGSLDGQARKLLVYSSANAAYASGHLLFIRGSALMAQQFDPSTLELKGDAVPIADQVLNDPSFNLAAFSASTTDALVYQTGRAHAGARLLVVDRTGKTLTTLGDMVEQGSARFSPDGRRVSAFLFDTKTRQQRIWIYDLQTGARTRATSGQGADMTAVWSPDGTQLLYGAAEMQRPRMYRQSLRESGSAGSFSEEREWPLDWSRDGRFILLVRFSDGKVQRDIWLLPTSGDGKPYPLVQTPADETDGRFSPDARWIAYASDESGQPEIYVKPTTEPEGKRWRISTAGGSFPVWGPDGKELLYVSRENKLMLAQLHIAGGSMEVAGVRPLFTLPAFTSGIDISPDGKRFVISRDLEPPPPSPLTMVQNWTSEEAQR